MRNNAAAGAVEKLLEDAELLAAIVRNCFVAHSQIVHSDDQGMAVRRSGDV